jgi:predicted MFS family arabinose efflux permease
LARVKDIDDPSRATPRAGLAADGYSNAYVAMALALLIAVSMLNNIDRILLGVLAEPIRKDLGLSDGQFGLIAGLFYAATYTCFALPIAHLAERRGRNIVMGLCVGLWSLATAASGATVSFATMALARVSTAVGESASVPISHSLVVDYVSTRFRSRALSCIGAGSSLGVMVGFILGGAVGEALGWRPAFLVIGLPGLAVALLVAVFLKDRRQGAGPAAAEADTPSMAVTLRSLLGNPLYLVFIVISVLCVMTSVSVTTWSAAYLMRAYHVSLASAGAWLGLTKGVAGIAGMLLGGYLSVKAVDGAGGLRLPAAVVALGGASIMLAYATSVWLVTIVGLSIGVMCVNVWYGAVFTGVQNIVRGAERAQAVAILTIFNSLLGAGFGPSLVGFLSDALGNDHGTNLRLPLIMMGGVGVLSGVLLVVADGLQRRAPDVSPQT